MKTINSFFIVILVLSCCFSLSPIVANTLSEDLVPNSSYGYNWTLWSFIATVGGILATLITLWWMIHNSKRENLNFSKQLDELKKHNQKADKQLQIQEKEYLEASERSMKLNTSLKENIEDIKEYLTKNDLIIKLTEKKDTIYGTFTSLWNSSFTKSASNVKDGTIVQNNVVMNGIITITTGITTFQDLIPNISADCGETCKLCIYDLEQLSKKRKKGDDISEWLKNLKQHFEKLEKEMSDCINNL